MLKKITLSATNLKKKLKKPLWKKSKSCSKIRLSSEKLNKQGLVKIKRSQSAKELTIKTCKSIKSFLKNNAFKKKKQLKINTEKKEISSVVLEETCDLKEDIHGNEEPLALIENHNEIDILGNKIEDVKKTVVIYMKNIEDRGHKLEDLEASSEKLQKSCQDLQAVSHHIKKINKNI